MPLNRPDLAEDVERIRQPRQDSAFARPEKASVVSVDKVIEYGH